MPTDTKFYDGLAPLYHLIYPDWEKSIKRQGEMLDSVIREMWGDVSDILDVSFSVSLDHTRYYGKLQLKY